MLSTIHEEEETHQKPYAEELPKKKESRKQRNILVVDDDYELAHYIHGCLTSNIEHIQVVVVGSAAEALSQIKEKVPDILMADLVMPEMDGFQLLAELETMNILAQMKVMVITGKEFSYADLVHLRKLKVTGILYKPFDSQKLVAKVQKIIKNEEV
jgi:DNA-binding response OmpR family regulator